MSPKISALLMIYNEEGQIRDCLETVKWADEIVICDSFSTDRTIEICREYTDKIYRRKFDNFGNQKRWILTKPTCEWVLFVEADERFPKKLADEIRYRLSLNEEYDGYWMPFKNYFLGKEMRSKNWVFSKIKLFKNGKGGWEDKLVHVNFVLDGKAGELENPILHYPYPNMKVLLVKLGRFTNIEVEEILVRGKRLTLYNTLKSFLRIPVTFCRHYFLWRGYKDGYPGFVSTLLYSFYDVVVNIKYWVIRQGWAKRNIR